MDIVAFVKHPPKIGETILGKGVRYFPGGKGSNQAIACQRLGCKTLMIGRIGDDAFGEQLLAFQKQEGIDASGIRRLGDTATGTAFITVSESAQNSIIVISGANALWEDDFLDGVTIETGDIVLAQFEIPDHAIQQAFQKAKACGATTLLNPTPARPIKEEIREYTDLIVINEHELAELTGSTIDCGNDESIFDAVEQFSQTGYQTVIVTLGDKGVRLLHQGQRHKIMARNVNAVDTTGAGDTFIGGLVAGLLPGLDLTKAAELGNIAASISVTRPGAASSIPTLAEVNRFLHASEPSTIKTIS